MAILMVILLHLARQVAIVDGMVRRVSIDEARDRFTGLVRDVQLGRPVELTRRGKRVAVLVPCDEYDRLRGGRPTMAEALQAWRSRVGVDFEGFTKDEVESWRDSSAGRDVRLE
jgi:prevent-host-death family protein